MVIYLCITINSPPAIQEDMQSEPFFMIDFDRLEQIIKDYYLEVGEDVPKDLLDFIERREYER